jgi:hypothetical protein
MYFKTQLDVIYQEYYKKVSRLNLNYYAEFYIMFCFLPLFCTVTNKCKVQALKFLKYYAEIISLVAQQPYSGLHRIIAEISRSYSDTPNSVGILWTSNRAVTETLICKKTQLSQ